jgi:hypothetical protein
MPGQRHRVFPIVTAAIAIPAALVIAVGANGGRATADGAAWKPLIAEAPAPQMLRVGVGSERGLQVKTILAARAISARFPEIREIGGVRQDSMHWHPEGLAIDVIIPDYRTAAGRALGDRIVGFVFENAQRFRLVHVIWRQVYIPTGAAPRPMADLGSDDANHYTHVHIATEGGGYPTGGERYFS